jgi:hypothetical protein
MHIASELTTAETVQQLRTSGSFAEVDESLFRGIAANLSSQGLVWSGLVWSGLV